MASKSSGTDEQTPTDAELIPWTEVDLSEFNDDAGISAHLDYADDLTYEQALTLLESVGVTPDVADENTIGDGFRRTEKADLVNVPALLMAWRFSDPLREAFGRPYVVVRGITRDGRRFWFTDGSTGICKELATLTRRRVSAGHPVPTAGLQLPKGLTSNTYETQDESGEKIQATTYHIAI